VKTGDILADCLTKRGGKTGGLPNTQEATKAKVHLVMDIAKDSDEDIGNDY
jgi:hypothetical protein